MSEHLKEYVEYLQWYGIYGFLTRIDQVEL